jgi:hypothetical protein
MMRKIRLGTTRRRGEVTETVVYDITKIGDPVGARIYEVGGDFIVIPEDDHFPVVECDNFNSAVNYFEQLVDYEDGGSFLL